METSSRRIPARQAVALALAGCHLILVACGAAHLHLLEDSHLPGRLLQACIEVTGANNNFGFFAPAVASQIRVSFDIKDGAGVLRTDRLEFSSSEVNLRIHTMLNFFTVEEAQDLLARSWAAMMFGRHPDARSVTVVVEVLDLPTMEKYRSGARPEWDEFYRAVFERREDAEQQAAPAQDDGTN